MYMYKSLMRADIQTPRSEAISSDYLKTSGFSLMKIMSSQIWPIYYNTDFRKNCKFQKSENRGSVYSILYSTLAQQCSACSVKVTVFSVVSSMHLNSHDL